VRYKTALIFIIFISSFYAQSENPIKINLEYALVSALQNNHDLKKARLDFEKAEEQVREAYGTSLFPAINADIRYDRAIKRPEFIIETPIFSGRFPAGTKNTITSSVTAEQPLFSGAMFLAVNIAKTFAAISEKAEQYSEADVIKNVKEAYYTFLLSKRMIELAQLQLKRAEDNLQEAKLLFDAGLVSEYDHIKANVQYQNMVPLLTESKMQSKLALNNLKILMGTELDTEIEVSDSLEYKFIQIPKFEDGLQAVIQRNKLLKQMELQTELYDLTSSYQFTQHLPKLNAFANWQVQTQENDERAFTDWRYINSVIVGVSLSVPIFRGWELDSKAQQAQIDYKKSVEDYLQTKKYVKNNYENSVLMIEKIEQQIKAYKGAVNESERGLEIASKRFANGLGSQIEVTNALVDFSQAKINYLQSVHNYYVEHANLDLLLGKSADEILIQN